MAAETAKETVEFTSPLNFERTLSSLISAIEAAGMTIFAAIDHAAGAQAAGLSMPPTTVLIYGQAKGGTPIMLASPAAALDLPLRVLVRATDDGTVRMAFHPAGTMLRRAGVPDALADRLGPAQHLLIAAIPGIAGPA